MKYNLLNQCILKGTNISWKSPTTYKHEKFFQKVNMLKPRINMKNSFRKNLLLNNNMNTLILNQIIKQTGEDIVSFSSKG